MGNFAKCLLQSWTPNPACQSQLSPDTIITMQWRDWRTKGIRRMWEYDGMGWDGMNWMKMKWTTSLISFYYCLHNNNDNNDNPIHAFFSSLESIPSNLISHEEQELNRWKRKESGWDGIRQWAKQTGKLRLSRVLVWSGREQLGRKENVKELKWKLLHSFNETSWVDHTSKPDQFNERNYG